MACISVSLSPAGPSRSMSSPCGRRSPSGQSTMRTTTLSPSSTPRHILRSRYISVPMRRVSGVTKTEFDVSCAVPTYGFMLRSTTELIVPSSSPSREWRATATTTLSPSRAPPPLRRDTKTSLSSSSTWTYSVPGVIVTTTPS